MRGRGDEGLGDGGLGAGGLGDGEGGAGLGAGAGPSLQAFGSKHPVQSHEISGSP